MLNIKILNNEEIPTELLDTIISIKSTAWKYTKKEQINWIKNNLNINDFHVLLYDKGEAISYLNLVSTNVFIDEQLTPILGVGNVCTSKTGQGYGGEILRLTSLFLKKNNIIGLLFCKENLVKFYNKFNWNEIKPDSLYIEQKPNDIHCMINIDVNLKKVQYNEKLF